MVISFEQEETWRQLLGEFEVVTFRAERRDEPNGTTWCTRGPGEPEEFEVRVEEVDEVAPSAESLDEFVAQSGFGTTDAWLGAIDDRYDGRPATGWLYRVEPVEIPAAKLKEYLAELAPDEFA